MKELATRQCDEKCKVQFDDDPNWSSVSWDIVKNAIFRVFWQLEKYGSYLRNSHDPDDGEFELQ